MAQNRPASIAGGVLAFCCNELLYGRARCIAFELAGLLVQPFERTQLLIAAELRLLYGRLKRTYRFVVDSERHWKWMSVLSPMRKGKPRGIAEPTRRAMDNLGNQSERLNGSWSHTGYEQQLCEIGGSPIRSCSQTPMQSSEHNVARTHVMMKRQLQMGQYRLLG